MSETEHSVSLSKRLWPLYVIAAVAVVVGVSLREPIIGLFQSHPEPTPVELELPATPTPTAAEVREVAAQRVAPTLEWADAETQRLLDLHLRAIAEYFDQARKGTEPFAKDALGYSSKWRLVIDYVPYTDGGRNERYIRDTFERHIFKSEDLAKVIEQTTAAYLTSIHSVENQMLVKMQADVADLSTVVLPAFENQATLHAAFVEAVESAASSSQVKLRADIATEVAAVVAGEVLTFVAIKLGVSGGILAAGAGSSWATAGIGLVVGVIVDQIVSWVWDWWADPKGDLAEKMSEQLDTIEGLILKGDAENPGLRDSLAQIQLERSRIRRVAVASLLAEESQ